MQTIIHTEASHGWGGQEMRILTECVWFRSRGFRCVLMAKDHSPIAARFREEGFEVIPLKFTRSSQPRDFAKCLRVFRDQKPALVGTHSNIDSRVALAAAACTRVKRRVRYRHVSIPVRASVWNKVIYRHFATGIVTTARSIAEDLTASFSLDASTVLSIPTGVRSIPADTVLGAREEIRGLLGLPPDARIISQISVLRSWKGHAHLIDAFDRLATSRPDVHLVLVGKGNMLGNLREQAAGMRCAARIHFAGHADDPYPYFQAADIVTLASTGGEGVPQSVLQASACARPVVATRVGGIPDVISDGVNGLLVPPADAEALAAALGCLLDDHALANRLGMEASRTFQHCGTIDHMGESLRRFLHL
jgi:glycosyltransferase involved in cell wall biosynthesis